MCACEVTLLRGGARGEINVSLTQEFTSEELGHVSPAAVPTGLPKPRVQGSRRELAAGRGQAGALGALSPGPSGDVSSAVCALGSPSCGLRRRLHFTFLLDPSVFPMCLLTVLVVPRLYVILTSTGLPSSGHKAQVTWYPK